MRFDVSFDFYANHEPDSLYGVIADIQWDTTLFAFDSAELNSEFTGATINSEPGRYQFGWVTAISPDPDSFMVRLNLMTKDVPGDYEISGSFDINEIPDPFVDVKTGTIAEGSSTGEDGQGITRPYIDIYPNPANPEFSVLVGLPEPAPLSVKMYDLLGRHIKTFADGTVVDVVSFRQNTTELASGVYVITVESLDFTITTTVTVIK